MELLRELAIKAFAVDSVWSIVLRAGIWFGLALVIIISADAISPDRINKNLKSNLGFFLMFICVSGALIYLLFGFTGQKA